MKGIYRLTNAANRLQAWQDWNELAETARQSGHSALVKQLQPPDSAGWRTIDKSIAKLRVAMNGKDAP